MSHGCEHGMLRRACLLCEMTEQRDELLAEVERLTRLLYCYRTRVEELADWSVEEQTGRRAGTTATDSREGT